MTEEQRAKIQEIYALFGLIVRRAMAEQTDLRTEIEEARDMGVVLESVHFVLNMGVIPEHPSAHSDHDFLKSLRIAPDLEPHAEDAPPGGEPR